MQPVIEPVIESVIPSVIQPVNDLPNGRPSDLRQPAAMNPRASAHSLHRALSLALCLSLSSGTALALQPDGPAAQPVVEPANELPPGDNNRRGLEGPSTTLAFKQASVEEIIPFIVSATGKVVMPQQDVLTRKITVLNDRPIPREQALDLVLQALQQNGIAVVETETTITLRDIGEVVRQDVPVIPPEVSVLNRRDLGAIVQKVFKLKHNTAKNVGEIVKDAVPDYAKLIIDEESNQVAVMGPVALLQRMERLISSLDRPPSGALQTETFRLRFADAESIKTNIEDLFGSGAAGSSGQNRNNRGGNNNNQEGGRGNFPVFRMAGQPGAEAATASSSEVRVSANSQQNAVTVVADPAILQQIRAQINDHWDLALPEEAVVPRVYDLKHSDPVKVRDLLEGLFGRGNPAAGRTGGQQGGGQQGGGGAGAASQGVGRLAGQFSFQAIPDAGRLVVVSKSYDNLAVIDKIIADLDQPQTVGLPTIIELKHASAEDLAEQLNALLAQDGTLAQVRRTERGLSQGSSNISPFSEAAADNAATQQTAAEDGISTTDSLAFWWQRSRTPTDRRASSNLIAAVRIVPVWRQNALMVTAPPEYKDSIVTLVSQLDKPGRQVLISAIVAEVSSEDSEAYGLRWSSQTINPTNGDNAISIGNNATGTANNWAGSIFDTSVLNTSVDLNILLQALAQKQGVSIMSEPRIFTSDNQEAEFFDGQDVSVPTNSQTTDNGTVTQSFDYRSVGVQLRVRPRITIQGDVDLRVNLQLSSIAPDRGPNNSFIFDRRQTTTQLIVKDAQTIVISGILRSEDSDILRKVPLLGDIPLIGLLFQSREKQKVNTELLVFITPVVVNNTTDLDGVNAPYRERLQQYRKDLEDVSGNAVDAGSQDGSGADSTPASASSPRSAPTSPSSSPSPSSPPAAGPTE
jgi:general secretion pathway protein D